MPAAASGRTPRRSRAGSAPAEDGQGPTPQTRARLRADPLLRLVRSGRLGPEHLAAAEEIRAIFEALTARLGARAIDLAATSSSGRRRGRFVQPFERMREDLFRRYRRIYRPWALEVRRMRRGQGIDPLALVLDIVIEGRPLGAAVARIGRRRQEALDQIVEALRAALELYARRAGWRGPGRPRAAVAGAGGRPAD